MKDKTIKSPVIKSRYTWSNWCVALWRVGSNVGSVKGGRGLVNTEKIARRMDSSILSRPSADKVIAWVQLQKGSAGISSITDYCKPQKTSGCENHPLMSRLFH